MFRLRNIVVASSSTNVATVAAAAASSFSRLAQQRALLSTANVVGVSVVLDARRLCSTLSSSSSSSSSTATPTTPSATSFVGTSTAPAVEPNLADPTTGATAESAQQLEQLLEELTMLLEEALPIGTLFKALSTDSRNFIAKNRLSLETFLLRYPQKFSIFKNRGDRNIYACKAGMAPANANQAQEVAGSTVGVGAVTNRKRARIYTVLKYIPNEWASYVALPIPDDVKKRIIRKPAKAYFEKNPRYFEVRFNPKVGHTFEVRRSVQLQEFMKQKAELERREQGGAAAKAGQTFEDAHPDPNDGKEDEDEKPLPEGTDLWTASIK